MSFPPSFIEASDSPYGSVTVASFHLFHKKAANHVLSMMGHYPLAVHVLRPEQDDYFLNIDGTLTVHRKYPVTAATTSVPEALTADGHRLFSAAMQSYESLFSDKKKEQANFVAWILLNLFFLPRLIKLPFPSIQPSRTLSLPTSYMRFVSRRIISPYLWRFLLSFHPLFFLSKTKCPTSII